MWCSEHGHNLNSLHRISILSLNTHLLFDLFSSWPFSSDISHSLSVSSSWALLRALLLLSWRSARCDVCPFSISRIWSSCCSDNWGRENLRKQYEYESRYFLVLQKNAPLRTRLKRVPYYSHVVCQVFSGPKYKTGHQSIFRNSRCGYKLQENSQPMVSPTSLRASLCCSLISTRSVCSRTFSDLNLSVSPL